MIVLVVVCDGNAALRSDGRATSPEAGHCAELGVSSTSHHEGSRRGSPMWRRSELILRDVGRTFPRLARFRSLETRMQMWRVLMAYSLFDPEVGNGRDHKP